MVFLEGAGRSDAESVGGASTVFSIVMCIRGSSKLLDVSWSLPTLTATTLVFEIYCCTEVSVSSAKVLDQTQPL